MLVTAVGTDNSGCSVYGVAEEQRELQFHQRRAVVQGARGKLGAALSELRGKECVFVYCEK